MAILESDFKLADAHAVVAQQMGFDGWQALISGADAMKAEIKQAKPGPVILSLEAQLFVTDIQASLAFYTGKLGFAVAFVYGEPPFYGQIVRDSARINLRQISEPVFTNVRQREGLLCASLTVATASEIKQLFLQYQASGVLFQQSLKKEPWGARTFVVSDLDDNLLLFAGPAN